MLADPAMASFKQTKLLAILFFVALTVQSWAQDDLLKKWLTIPPNQGGLVLIIDSDVSLVTIRDENGKTLDVTKWPIGLPFVRQYRVNPGTYQIRLRGPIGGVSVVTKPAILTYLRLSTYKDGLINPGIQISAWQETPTKHVADTIRAAFDRGIGGATINLGVLKAPSNVLMINTEPPWPIPPPPK